MNIISSSTRRFIIGGRFERLRCFSSRQNGELRLTLPSQKKNRISRDPNNRTNDSTDSASYIHGDVENSDERKVAITGELRDILNGLGMSESQWKIRESKFPAYQDTTPVNTRKTRRRRNQSNGRPIHFEYVNSEEPNLSDPYFYNNPRRNSAENNVMTRLKVNSVHAATSIDLTSALTDVFGPSSRTPAKNYTFGKTKLIAELPPVINTNDANNITGGNRPDRRAEENLHPRFVAIFRYGSIVFFNISTEEAKYMAERIIEHSIDPAPTGYEKRENFEIAVSPNMLSTAHVNADFATVKELDSNCVAVISTIMGQTVAFDSYNATVDELLAKFASINATVKKTGNFTDMERETLFKVVAQNNSLFIDMIAKLGIKERSDTAWNLSQYERVYEEMKNEFEIESRFEAIEFKLNLIQQNTKFFLNVLDTQKSNTLEWIIIVLISFECILMLMEMSGIGPSLFDGDLLNITSGKNTGISSGSPNPPVS